MNAATTTGEQEPTAVHRCDGTWRTEPALRAAAEDFLYTEAELLDTWQLEKWLELFTPDAHYLLPSTDLPGGNPATDLMLIHDDRFLLEQRVRSLLTRAAHAEFPHSRTRRLVTNVRARSRTDGRIDLAANFAVYRSRYADTVCYVGHYRHLIAEDPGTGFRFVERRAVLDHDALRPHGKVSIIL